MGAGKYRERVTKRELSQLYYLSCEIEQDKKRLEELEDAAQGITQHITGMPTTGNIGDKVGKYAAEIADLRSMIEKKIQRCWKELRRLNSFIDGIEDSQMRQILTLRYINHMSWQQVANAMGNHNTADNLRMRHDRFLTC